MPPTSASASSAAGSSSKAARRWSVASGPYSFSSKTRSRTSVLASGDCQRLGEQVAEEVHLHPAVAQHVGEPVVLLARARRTHSTSSKSSASLLVGREPLQLQIRAVQDDAAQPPGLGVDVESHGSRPSHAARTVARARANHPTRSWVRGLTSRAALTAAGRPAPTPARGPRTPPRGPATAAPRPRAGPAPPDRARTRAARASACGPRKRPRSRSRCSGRVYSGP